MNLNSFILSRRKWPDGQNVAQSFLGKWKELFFWLPVEELIKRRQKEYYDALGASDKKSDSYEFVYFMLNVIKDSLKQQSAAAISRASCSSTAPDRLNNPIRLLLDVLGDKTLSASGSWPA